MNILEDIIFKSSDSSGGPVPPGPSPTSNPTPKPSPTPKPPGPSPTPKPPGPIPTPKPPGPIPTPKPPGPSPTPKPPGPTPTPKPPGPTPTPKPGPGPGPRPAPHPYSNKLDIIGYIGSGGCVQGGGDGWQKPLSFNNGDGKTISLEPIPDYYNIVVLAFWGAMPGDSTWTTVPSWLQKWRTAQSDPWGRKRMLLASIGGQTGSNTQTINSYNLIGNAIKAFRNNEIDGIDIDIETASNAAVYKDWINDPSNIHQGGLKKAIKEGMIVTLVPETTYNYLATNTGDYHPFLEDPTNFSWIAPQFYNDDVSNGGLAGLAPPSGGEFSENIPFLMKFIDALKSDWKIPNDNVGLLTPANTCGANDITPYDLTELSAAIIKNNIKHVGCWDITYDAYNNYTWAGTIASCVLGIPSNKCNPNGCPSPWPNYSGKQTASKSPLSQCKPRPKHPCGQSKSCGRNCITNMGGGCSK